MDNYSIQEAALKYANEVLANINAAAAETVGVDVMWFRLIPDQKNRDVIFQTYTLYGVEDCPLHIKAVYTDMSYDDAAITYQIMGLNYAVPLTLEIAVKTWEEATGNDGTIPQKGDIVFIPMSRKLLQVVSMTPVKALAAQLTSYKMNMETYKPARSIIVGENLRTSIEENTTNLMNRFGKELTDEIRDIVDDKQISLFTSTEKDKYKELSPDVSEDSGILDIRSIISNNLVVDGHIAARSYYDMNGIATYAVRYKNRDFIKSTDERCLSLWINIRDYDKSQFIKNVKEPSETTLTRRGGEYYLHISSLGKKFKEGDLVSFERGQIIVPGTVVSENEIMLNKDICRKLSANSSSWYSMPGFAVIKDNVISLLEGKNDDGDEICIRIRRNSFISIKINGTEKLVRILSPLKENAWYGIIFNMGETLSLNVYSGNGKLEKHCEMCDIDWDGWSDMTNVEYYIRPSETYITNIRLYKASNLDIDKQIKDLVSYNAEDDSKCVINDSADVYLNKPFVGVQR